MSELLQRAQALVERAQALGVDEISVTASRGVQSSISRRAGKVEQATASTTRGVVLSLMVDGRYSSHSTSDLRPEALDAFLVRAIEATRFLEPDPDRAQAPGELCGRGATDEELETDDPAWYAYTPADRAEAALALEASLDDRWEDDVVSTTTHVADGQSESARVMSNGFSGHSQGAWFAQGAERTLLDGDKRPESSAWYAARFLADLPSPDEIAAETERRVRARVGARPAPSGRYPLLLSSMAAGRILGALAGPLSGGSLHERRSCLADRLGTAIGSAHLTILDDPTIPRGLGSRPWDGDALVARPRTIIDQGVLSTYNIGVYYGRKLGMDPTSGSRSNWVIPPGQRSPDEIARDLGRCIRITGFMGGNSNGTTGDFSLGIRGELLEGGEVVQPLAEMNITGNLTSFFHQLVEVADDPWQWSPTRSPTLVFEDVQFSGT